MHKFVLIVLFLLPFSAMALDVTDVEIAGKWHIEAIVMGTLGEPQIQIISAPLLIKW
ncbi:hypothetical protein AltI4_25280 [Alteromonas sp. I4]|nr:hypothetical protein AltI4_25280 [Alteromonas sp. I4]